MSFTRDMKKIDKTYARPKARAHMLENAIRAQLARVDHATALMEGKLIEDRATEVNIAVLYNELENLREAVDRLEAVLQKVRPGTWEGGASPYYP